MFDGSPSWPGRRTAVWIELFDHDARMSVDSCGCLEIEDALAGFDAFVAQAENSRFEVRTGSRRCAGLNEIILAFFICKDNHMPRSEFGRIALFIDGANLHATARTLGFDIDYKRLLREFQSRGTLLRAFYYTAIVEDQEYSSIRPLIDWLDYNGYTVVTKAAKEFIDANGRRKVKGNMDIELAVDAMEIAAHVDQIVLFSGDGDFRPLIEALQRRGVRVTVVSTISTQPPMVADELRRQADAFIDLVELKTVVARTLEAD